jgi:tetratricopeptide (TPR) repeat protein
MLAVGTIHNTVKLWDLATSKEKFAFRVGGGWIEIRSLAFSPDSKMLAAGTALGIVMLWDVQTGQLRASFKGHTAVVGSLAFSRDGKTLATGSGDWTVKLWDVVTGQERVSLKGHKGSVNSITFAPDGKTLATGSDDWTAKLWRAATDQEATAKKTELDLDDPASPAAMNSWRDRLLKAGRMPEAEEAYRQAVSRLDKLAAEFPNVPDYPQDLARSRFALVLLLASSGRPQEAEQAYRQAVDLFEKVAAKLPNTPDFRVELGTSLNNLAWPLATSADPSFRNTGWALDLAKKAVALRPRDTYAWNTLGVAHYCAGDWHAAIDALAKSEELAPGRSFGFNAFFLAMAHWQLGEKDEARNWYDQAVQWMEKNKQQYDELKRFREEAAELLGVKEKKN